VATAIVVAFVPETLSRPDAPAEGAAVESMATRFDLSTAP
jgi:hypothetical protein